MDRPPVGSVDDLATLAQLDEKILLNELKVRYSKDNIYVSITSMMDPFYSVCGLVCRCMRHA